MDFQEIQSKVIANANSYGDRYNIKIDKEFSFLKLIEEIGELAEAVLTHEQKSRPEKFLAKREARKKIGQELADIVGMAIVTSHIFKIDLERAIRDKWIDEK